MHISPKLLKEEGNKWDKQTGNQSLMRVKTYQTNCWICYIFWSISTIHATKLLNIPVCILASLLQIQTDSSPSQQPLQSSNTSAAPQSWQCTIQFCCCLLHLSVLQHNPHGKTAQHKLFLIKVQIKEHPMSKGHITKKLNDNRCVYSVSCSACLWPHFPQSDHTLESWIIIMIIISLPVPCILSKLNPVHILIPHLFQITVTLPLFQFHDRESSYTFQFTNETLYRCLLHK